MHLNHWYAGFIFLSPYATGLDLSHVKIGINFVKTFFRMQLVLRCEVTAFFHTFGRHQILSLH